MFNKTLDQGQAGDNVGCLLRGVKREEIRARPGAGQARLDHAAHEVRGRGLRAAKEEGGRHTPFFSGYRPQFYFRTTDVTGIGELAGRAPRCACPATTSRSSVELLKPIAMDEGLRFAIREGGKTVGSGVVTKIVE